MLGGLVARERVRRYRIYRGVARRAVAWLRLWSTEAVHKRLKAALAARVARKVKHREATMCRVAWEVLLGERK